MNHSTTLVNFISKNVDERSSRTTVPVSQRDPGKDRALGLGHVREGSSEIESTPGILKAQDKKFALGCKVYLSRPDLVAKRTERTGCFESIASHCQMPHW